MNSDTIRPLQVILIIMTVIGLKNHVTIIPVILSSVGRDGWASVLLASLLHLPWLLLLLYIHKNTNQQDIMLLLTDKFGKVFTNGFKYALAMFFLILAALTMAEMLIWIGASFLPETSGFPLLVIFTALCVALACSSIRTFSITNIYVLVLIVVFGFFVAFANLKLKNYLLLMPFFEHGFRPVMRGLIYPASGMVELTLLLFIQHQIKGRMRFIHYMIILGIITVLTLGPLVGSISEFGPHEAMKQRYPAYEEWGLASIGQFIENLSFLSIYQWLGGAFIRIGLLLYVVIHLLDWKGNVKRTWLFMAPVFLGLCILLLMMEDDTFVKLKGEYVLPITFYVLFGLSIFFTIIAKFLGKSGKEEKYDND